jgi:hypothetical protein
MAVAGKKESAPDEPERFEFPPVPFDWGPRIPKETRWVPMDKGAVFQ